MLERKHTPFSIGTGLPSALPSPADFNSVHSTYYFAHIALTGVTVLCSVTVSVCLPCSLPASLWQGLRVYVSAVPAATRRQGQRYRYSRPSLCTKDMLQDPPWVPGTVGGTRPRACWVFLSIHTYRSVTHKEV